MPPIRIPLSVWMPKHGHKVWVVDSFLSKPEVHEAEIQGVQVFVPGLGYKFVASPSDVFMTPEEAQSKLKQIQQESRDED